MRRLHRWAGIEWGVALILLGSYAYFWHSRDWNTASRLMLTYAVVDRGTVVLDGLDTQTGDIARFHGGLEQLGRRFGQRLNFLLHVRPVAKAVCARNHKLRRPGQNLGFLFRVAGSLSPDRARPGRARLR